MFTIIFTFTFVLAYVAAEIPSNIHVCDRKNPNLDKCIMDSITNLREDICKGMPELKSPPIEPFTINSITISDVDNAKLFLRDVQITGLCDFTINSAHIDLDKLNFNINALFKRAYLNGTYDFDIRILVPFVHKGPVFLTSDNIIETIDLDMKIINRGDKKYIYVSKMNSKLDVKTLSSKFEIEGEKKTLLNEILSTFLGSNKEEFIDRVKPSLEKEISKQLLTISNGILKHFTYDELFPDKRT